MGNFFNKLLMKRKYIPSNQGIKGILEKARREFNLEEKEELTVKEKRQRNIAKAREAKQKKKESINA